MIKVKLAAFILILSFLTDPSAAALQNDTLIDGTGFFVTSGENLELYQGYSLRVESVNQVNGKAWLRLSLDDEVIREGIFEEGETLTYSRDHEIINVTVDTIYSSPGGELVTFKPVYQYIDPTLPDPVPREESDDADQTDENDELENEDNTPNRTVAGFEIIWTFGTALFAAFYVRRK